MTAQEKTLWKQWADSLRQEMMSNLTAEITKSVEAIASEVSTTKPKNTLQSARFWRSCQSPSHALTVAGFEVAFETAEDGYVKEVRLSLNPTWMAILQRVIDRKNVKLDLLP